MANTADHHLKLLLGDFAVQLALVRAENDTLHETVASLRAQLAAATTTNTEDLAATT